jgi:hypothetical protein
LMVYYTALAWWLSDDGDDDRLSFGMNPLSSEFLKIKFGDTRLDPLAGLSQAAVFMARTGYALGKAVGLVDEDKKKDSFNKKVWKETASDFMWSKAHPTIGKTANILSGEDPVGNEASIFSEATSIGPLAYKDMWDAFDEHGMYKGAKLAGLIFFGESVQIYNKLDPKTGDDPLEHATKLAKLVHANARKPERDYETIKHGPNKGNKNYLEDAQDYQDRLSVWEAKYVASHAWLEKHSDDPVVQEAVRAVKAEVDSKEKKARDARNKAIREGRTPARR